MGYEEQFGLSAPYLMRNEDIFYIYDWMKFFNRFSNYYNTDLSTNTKLSTHIYEHNVAEIVPTLNTVNQNYPSIRGESNADIMWPSKHYKYSFYRMSYNKDRPGGINTIYSIQDTHLLSDLDWDYITRFDNEACYYTSAFYLSGNYLENVIPLSNEVLSITPISDVIDSNDELVVGDSGASTSYTIKPYKDILARGYHDLNKIQVIQNLTLPENDMNTYPTLSDCLEHQYEAQKKVGTYGKFEYTLTCNPNRYIAGPYFFADLSSNPRMFRDTTEYKFNYDTSSWYVYDRTDVDLSASNGGDWYAQWFDSEAHEYSRGTVVGHQDIYDRLEGCDNFGFLVKPYVLDFVEKMGFYLRFTCICYRGKNPFINETWYFYKWIDLDLDNVLSLDTDYVVVQPTIEFKSSQTWANYIRPIVQTKMKDDIGRNSNLSADINAMKITPDFSEVNLFMKLGHNYNYQNKNWSL